MRGILEFKLPEEREEFKLAQQGVAWKIVVCQLLEFLRSETKHSDHSAEEYAVFDRIRQRLLEDLRDRELSVW